MLLSRIHFGPTMSYEKSLDIYGLGGRQLSRSPGHVNDELSHAGLCPRSGWYSESAFGTLEPVSYSASFAASRSCQAVTRSGAPCKAWAMWGRNRCNMHSGFTWGTTGRGSRVNSRRPACTCPGWPWPHRIGARFCVASEGGLVSATARGLLPDRERSLPLGVL